MPRLRVPAAVAGLTTRGRCLVTAGLACAAAAALLGQRDLVRVGVLLIALPLVCASVVARTRYRLSCTRELLPTRVAAGDPARVGIRLDNVSRLPTSVLLLEDQLPYSLGGRPRFVLDRLEAGGHRSVSYPIRSDVRGRFRIGPLSVRLTDPFGCCELIRAFSATSELVVTPAVWTLPNVRLGGEWGGGGETSSRAVASAGDNDVGTRTYRQGDDLRKVHWRSTARTGQLMVRQEQQNRLTRATVLLDTRATGHRGEGPGSSFEWAVSAAASIALHLVRRGYAVALAGNPLTAIAPASAADTSGQHSAGYSAHSTAEGVLLDLFATSVTGPDRSIETALAEVRSQGTGGAGLLVAVLGALDANLTDRLARLPRTSGGAIAVLLDTETWTTPDARTTNPTALHACQRVLTAAGWRVVTVRHGDSLPLLWPEAGIRAGAHPGRAAAPPGAVHR